MISSFWVRIEDHFVCYFTQLRSLFTCGEAVIYMMRNTKNTLYNTYQGTW